MLLGKISPLLAPATVYNRTNGISAAGAQFSHGRFNGGKIGRDEIVICNLTGHGLKQPESIRIAEAGLGPIAPTLEALRQRAQRMER